MKNNNKENIALLIFSAVSGALLAFCGLAGAAPADRIAALDHGVLSFMNYQFNSLLASFGITALLVSALLFFVEIPKFLKRK